jgi:hypothetical protein
MQVYTFCLNEQQAQQFEAWWQAQRQKTDAYTGAIGGRWTFAFTPTSLGIAVTVRDALTNEEIDLTDYGEW